MGKTSLIRKIEKLENASSYDPRFLICIADKTYSPTKYSGSCGKDLTEEQFNQWLKSHSLDEQNQIYIIEICVNEPPTKLEITVKGDNACFSDLLKAHDALTQRIEASKHVKVETPTEA
jgi:hypothetical protein